MAENSADLEVVENSADLRGCAELRRPSGEVRSVYPLISTIIKIYVLITQRKIPLNEYLVKINNIFLISRKLGRLNVCVILRNPLLTYPSGKYVFRLNISPKLGTSFQ